MPPLALAAIALITLLHWGNANAKDLHGKLENETKIDKHKDIKLMGFVIYLRHGARVP